MAVTYEPIATTTLGSATATVDFTSIPATYTDLIVILNVGTSANANVLLRFNSDTASNYSNTQLYGTGSAAGSDRETSQTSMNLSYNASTDRLFVKTDILNYANATTNKTLLVRNAGGSNENVRAKVGLWRKTPEAITSINLLLTSGNFASGSTFTLYGIKAA